ncbi:hypothetical protein like AT1G24140 [Hibiscus trionum]|uniref:Peptidase metallopeptidase domain-containing protein n=1 Tax=Hibiscus trionum TaxID=183268 RepID=A0A9W7LKW9_HIBTR|nr:hypothetical protein like AT1G24140 [Hibiscus trionum]
MATNVSLQLFGALLLFLALQPSESLLNHGMFHLVCNHSSPDRSPKWNNLQLSYGLQFDSPPPAGLNFRQVIDAIDAAFKTWQPVLPRLVFRKVRGVGGGVNVLVYVNAGPLVPSDPFMKLVFVNVTVNWSTGLSPAGNQLDMQSAVVHEVGHVLGLGHSQSPDAVMYHVLDYGRIKRNLSQDDITGLQNLYG